MIRRLSFLLLFVLGLSLLGCATEPEPMTEEHIRPCPVKVLGLAPLQAAWPGPHVGEVVCPITGELFVGQVVPEKALEDLTLRLPAEVSRVFNCPLITPLRLGGQLPVMPASPGPPVRQALAQAGRSVGADAVLTGTIFRYQEREGSSVAITRAASVYLGLYLIDSQNGAILWRGFFDETQKSLTENLFKIYAFFNRGARWLTAAELGATGIRETVRHIPNVLAR
jgi:hypothetical protein